MIIKNYYNKVKYARLGENKHFRRPSCRGPASDATACSIAGKTIDGPDRLYNMDKDRWLCIESVVSRHEHAATQWRLQRLWVSSTPVADDRPGATRNSHDDGTSRTIIH